MSVTKPITDSRILDDVMSVYEAGTKNHLIMAYALNSGLRVSDMLRATVGESRRGTWIKREQKTGKHKVLQLPPNLQILIIDFIEANGLADVDPLFFNDRDKSKAISRQAVDKVIRNAGDMVGIKLSAHSLRKTFGYMTYTNKIYDLAELQELFNHSSSKTTLRYIGVTEESLNNKMKHVSIGI